MITQDDINEVRFQISRIGDMDSGRQRSEQAAYALSRLLDLIEILSNPVTEPACQPDTSPRSSNPPLSA